MKNKQRLKQKQEEEQEYLKQKQKRELLVKEQKHKRQLIKQEQKHERQTLALIQSQQRTEQILEEQEFSNKYIRFCSCVHIWFRMRICMFKCCTNIDES